VNLYRRSGLSLERFGDLLYDARCRTQQHTGAIRAERIDKGAGGLSAKPKMAYFFGVLQNALSLNDDATSEHAEAGSPAVEASPSLALAAIAPMPRVGTNRDFAESVANAAMSRNVNWHLARQLAQEDPHLLAAWLDHGGTWALARDPGAELAKLVRSGEHLPQRCISGNEHPGDR